MLFAKCLLHVRVLFAYAFCTHHSALYIGLDLSAFYIGLKHTPECFLHMHFTHNKVLFIYIKVLCVCFLHKPQRLLHRTWPKYFLLKKSALHLITHQNAFCWCFLHVPKCFLHVRSAFCVWLLHAHHKTFNIGLGLNAFYITLEQTPKYVCFLHTRKCFLYMRVLLHMLFTQTSAPFT